MNEQTRNEIIQTAVLYCISEVGSNETATAYRKLETLCAEWAWAMVNDDILSAILAYVQKEDVDEEDFYEMENTVTSGR